jgi:hypothetical protein
MWQSGIGSTREEGHRGLGLQSYRIAIISTIGDKKGYPSLS